MKTIVTDAIILKRIDYGEADRILTVLTSDKGKLSLLAKGVRRSKSKLAGGLELFSVTSISYIDGRSDLKTVVGTQLKQFYDHIIADVERTMLAYEFLKLSHKATEDEAEEQYFDLLAAGLASLHDFDIPMQLTNAWFRLQLLIASGEGVSLEADADGKPFTEDTSYEFDYEHMAFRAARSGNFSPQHIKFMRLLSRASSPQNVLKVQGIEGLLPSVVQLLSAAHRINS